MAYNSGDKVIYNGLHSVVVGVSRGENKVYSIRITEGGVFQKISNIPESSLTLYEA